MYLIYVNANHLYHVSHSWINQAMILCPLLVNIEIWPLVHARQNAEIRVSEEYFYFYTRLAIGAAIQWTLERDNQTKHTSQNKRYHPVQKSFLGIVRNQGYTNTVHIVHRNTQEKIHSAQPQSRLFHYLHSFFFWKKLFRTGHGKKIHTSQFFFIFVWILLFVTSVAKANSG